jgi:CheY-like chemotaxis protein
VSARFVNWADSPVLLMLRPLVIALFLSCFQVACTGKPVFPMKSKAVRITACAMSGRIKTVLCVDDEENGLTLRKRVLEKSGYRVLTACSGEEALRIYNSEPIDAVVLDYFMPGMNGLKVAARLKEIGAVVPIIILSAYTPILDEALGLADCWITKAAGDPSELSRAIAELDGRRSHSTVAQ